MLLCLLLLTVHFSCLVPGFSSPVYKEYHRTFIQERDRDMSGYDSEYNLFSCLSRLTIFPQHLVHFKSYTTVCASHWLKSKTQIYMNFLLRNPWIPGWILTTTLVLSVLVLIWICCATVATAVDQYVPSEASLMVKCQLLNPRLNLIRKIIHFNSWQNVIIPETEHLWWQGVHSGEETDSVPCILPPGHHYQRTCWWGRTAALQSEPGPVWRLEADAQTNKGIHSLQIALQFFFVLFSLFYATA